MATTGNPNSSVFRLRIGGGAVARARGGAVTWNHAPRSITTKDSGAWEEYAEGMRSGEASVEGILWGGGIPLIASITSRTPVGYEMGSGVTGDTKISGNCYLTKLSVDSPGQEETTTFSATLQFTGEQTTSTY